MKKTLSFLLALCMALSLFAGCQQNNDQTPGNNTSNTNQNQTNNTQQPDEGEVKYEEDFEFTYVGDQPLTLNQFTSSSNTDLDALKYLQASLFRRVAGKLENDICENYTISDDGLTYTFTLRDAVWSDGEPITSQQFEYALMRYLDPNGGSMYGYYYQGIKNGTAYYSGEMTDWEQVGVDCPDDRTLVLTLSVPNTAFLDVLTSYGLFPLRQDFVEAQGDSYGTSAETVQYSGPYTLESWTLNKEIIFTKNEKYWNSDNWFAAKKISNVYIADKGTAFSMYENGEVDSLWTMDDQYKDMLPEEELYLYNFGQSGMLFINQTGASEDAIALMQNRNFRQALNYAIDREAATLGEDTLPSTRIIASEFLNEAGTPIRDTYEMDYCPTTGDVAKAKEYLDKALDELGYASAAELPTIRLTTYESTHLKTYLELIVDMWKQNLGIESISFSQLPIGSAIGQFYSLDYDLFYFTTGHGVSVHDLISFTRTGSDINLGIWVNEEFNSLIDQMKAEPDPTKQLELMIQAEAIFNEDMPMIQLDEGMVLACTQSEFVDLYYQSGACPFVLMKKLAD